MPLNARDCDWIVDQLHWDRLDVGTFVPEGFEQYVRIFHPAHSYLKNGDVTPVRWSDIASANGRSLFEEMRRFTEHNTYTEADRDLWHSAPSVGEMPTDLCLRLSSTLAKHTQTPASVVLGIWEGFGGMQYPPDLIGMLDLPWQRRLVLCERSLENVMHTFGSPDWPGYQAPNLWWPADRAWCVATEIDYAWSYVGGSAACIAEIAADAMFEVLPTSVVEGNFMEL